ncbi:hypothetical protein IHE44_0013752 [Lamprotornis superbus]|uniref:Uncharacterized protein n=1 Tax=Lamprotornis superbus TaxID=245042 RepID=A0A835NT58_9PASS|nr:hypothetical protein IHE44_0013752 [Lamprotornis superbus]
MLSCEDGSASRLTSTVKPLRELSPSEAVIDIKPEPDDLIDEDLNFVQENPLSRKKPIEESSRKRRLPVVSSVVKVKKFCNDGEDEEEEEDYGLRTGSISSSVSVPAKPERRGEEEKAKQQKNENALDIDYCDPESVVHSDTRSFILKKPKLPEDMVPQSQQLGKKGAEAVRVHSGRLIQTRDQLAQPEKPSSPKFIVTLDGVPSPPGYLSDQEEEDMCIMEGLKPITQHMCAGKGLKSLQAQQMQIVTRQLENCDEFSLTADLRINACSSIQTVNMMRSALSQTVLTLMPVDEPPIHLLNQCTRPDCTFYHPTVAVPPRHALKWTRTQIRTWKVKQFDHAKIIACYEIDPRVHIETISANNVMFCNVPDSKHSERAILHSKSKVDSISTNRGTADRLLHVAPGNQSVVFQVPNSFDYHITLKVA